MVRVEVAETDRERATQILEEDEQRMAGATNWICGRCDEKNDRTFDLCWSCSKRRSASDASFDDENLDGESDEEPSADASLGPLLLESEVSQREVDDGNPYRPPSLTGIARPTESNRKTVEFDESLDHQVRRAWMSAIMGVMILPPLLSLYSVYLCMGVMPSAKSHAHLRTRLVVACIINALSVPFWLIIWIQQF